MSERRADEGRPAGQSWAAGRERARRAWRDIHEAVHHASDATGCAQYAVFADLRARRGDVLGDLDALQCMQQNGQLTDDAARRYERLHADFTALMRQGDQPEPGAAIEGFIAAVQDLEEQLWALVPAERLPAGMFAPVNVGTSGQVRLVRRLRRTGELAS